jgi:hypothetical protein
MKTKTKSYNKALDGKITNVKESQYEAIRKSEANKVKTNGRPKKKVSKSS